FKSIFGVGSKLPDAHVLFQGINVREDNIRKFHFLYKRILTQHVIRKSLCLHRVHISLVKGYFRDTFLKEFVKISQRIIKYFCLAVVELRLYEISQNNMGKAYRNNEKQGHEDKEG